MKRRRLRCMICHRNSAGPASGYSHCAICWMQWVSTCNRSKDRYEEHRKQVAGKLLTDDLVVERSLAHATP